MGFFDNLLSLFRANQGTQPTADDVINKYAAQAPTYNNASNAAQSAQFPGFGDYQNQAVKTAQALARSKDVLSWLTNSGPTTDALVGAAKMGAPANYFAMLGAQPKFTSEDTATKQGQLGFLQNLARTGLVSGQNIEPNNIMAALPGYLKEMRAQFGDLGPQGDTSAPNASVIPPQPGVPNSAPVAMSPLPAPGMSTSPAAAPQNGLENFRAMLDRWGQFNSVFGDPKSATDYFKLARDGNPNNTTTFNGQVVDPITAQPLTGTTAQDYNAQGAGKIAAAQEFPHVAGQEAIDNNRIGGEKNAHIAETNNEKDQTPVTGYSTINGQPMVAPASALKTGAIPNFAPGTNPYIEQHEKELGAASDQANQASNDIIQLKQLDTALQGLKTGAWGESIQDIRRGLTQIGIGGDVVKNAATKGDIANELATEVAAIRARAASGGRTALGTFNIFRNVKPGVLSTDPHAQIQALLPALQRQIDYGQFVNGYYNQPGNWNKMDAPTQFRAQNPDQKYIDAAFPQAQTKKLPTGVKLSPGRHVDRNGNSIMVNKDGTYTEIGR